MFEMFDQCSKCSECSINVRNVRNVRSMFEMFGMFDQCSKCSMFGMFEQCSSNVRNDRAMFEQCSECSSNVRGLFRLYVNIFHWFWWAQRRGTGVWWNCTNTCNESTIVEIATIPLLIIFYLYARYEIEDTNEHATRLGTAMSFRPMHGADRQTLSIDACSA